MRLEARRPFALPPACTAAACAVAAAGALCAAGEGLHGLASPSSELASKDLPVASVPMMPIARKFGLSFKTWVEGRHVVSHECV